MLGSLLYLAALAAASPSAAPTDPPKDGIEVITRMRERYLGKWYRTLTFVQKTTLPDGKVETWYEAAELPGKLRIDIAPLEGKNTILFRNDTLYDFKGGKLTETKPLIHPLMVLGFDIYRMPENEAIEKLKGLKFDLSIFHEDTWQGRSVYVVGAKAGDAHSAQFWIDKKNLYFVRMIRPAGKDGTQTQETQFNKYVKLGGGWMSPEVVFLVDNRVVTIEEYSDLHANVTLPNKLFDPQSFATVHWKE